MTYELLFVNGNRGLTANLNGRFIFPDRKSSIKEEGLYNCTITVDKDKYAFVTGTPIKTSRPSDRNIKNLICQEVFDEWSNKSDTHSKHYIKQIGDSTIIFLKTNHDVILFYFDEKGVRKHLLSYNFNDNHDRNVARLYNINNFEDTFENYAEIRDKRLRSVICNWAKPIKDNTLMKVATAAVINCAGHYSYRKPVNITLYDDKIIIVETAYCDIKNKHVFIFNGDVIELNYDADIFVNENASCKTVDINDVIKFAADNHLGTRLLGDQETYGKSIVFMGNTVTVTCLNGRLYLDAITDESKEKVAESFRNLESFRKRIGKQISKTALNDFSKLAPCNILDLNWD